MPNAFLWRLISPVKYSALEVERAAVDSFVSVVLEAKDVDAFISLAFETLDVGGETE